MSCCLSVYFLVVFKAVLRGLWTFGFVRLKIIFWIMFVELDGLLTPSVTRLSLVSSPCGEPSRFCLVETLFAYAVETLVASAFLRAQVT